MSGHRTPVEAKRTGMQPLARLPVFFALEGKRVVVAGGNAAAAWKAELLSAVGAKVEVFCAEPSGEMLQVEHHPPRGAVRIVNRPWAIGDLVGASLAVGAFDNDHAAGEFAAAARSAGAAVNVVDRPAFCDFSFGAVVNRSPLVIGISTDGAAPVLAQAIRARLEGVLPQGFSRWAAAASRWRSAIKASGLSFAGRRRFWQLFTSHAMANPGKEPSEGQLAALLDEVKSLGSATENGSVTLVGAGPGDPELLTLRAVRALQSADVIMFDDLVSREVLDFARREAKKMLVGKTGHRPSCRQQDINQLMVALAKAGRRVVRLKGGDPLIFARACEEIEVCRAAGITLEIVPGITAAQGAASRLGVALTGRGKVRQLQFITGHGKDGNLPTDLDWRSIADPGTTTAVYMPAKTLSVFVERAMQHGLDPETPAVAVASATRADETRLVTCVADLPRRFDEVRPMGPVLVMIGSAFEDHVARTNAGLESHAINSEPPASRAAWRRAC